jgi:hypothetical protein
MTTKAQIKIQVPEGWQVVSAASDGLFGIFNEEFGVVLTIDYWYGKLIIRSKTVSNVSVWKLIIVPQFEEIGRRWHVSLNTRINAMIVIATESYKPHWEWCWPNERF